MRPRAFFRRGRSFLGSLGVYGRHALSSKRSFDRYHRKWKRIPGWLSYEEAKWLFETARDQTIEGDVVEIGSFHGKSTVCLALGVKLNNHSEGRLFAIDPHTGGIGYVLKHPDAPVKMPSLGPLLHTLVQFDVQGSVVPWVIRSEAAYELWSRGRVRLLFVDGWHSYEACYFDITKWGSLVSPGGIIAVHDYGWSEVKLALHDSLRRFPGAQLDFVGSNLAEIRLAK